LLLLGADQHQKISKKGGLVSGRRITGTILGGEVSLIELDSRPKRISQLGRLKGQAGFRVEKSSATCS
jgi:hypothetical protein